MKSRMSMQSVAVVGIGLLLAAGERVGAATPKAAEPALQIASLEGVSNQTYRLYDGVVAYVANPKGNDFTVTVQVRDLNIFANGPREMLFKVYDPDGTAVVREVIPDDGVTSPNYLPRIGGWDHELDYYAWCYAHGEPPMTAWSAYGDPRRLATVASRTYTRTITGGKKGIYRVNLVGDRDHYVTLKLDPALEYGICGHHSWLQGHGNQWPKSYLYVPRGAAGLHLAFAEPDLPRTRHFTLTAPDGRKFFDGTVPGVFTTIQTNFDRAGMYDDQLFTLEVSNGAGDYLLHIEFTYPSAGVFEKYTGFGSLAVLATDKDAARAIQGGTIIEDGQVFWHMFQVRQWRWLKAHPGDKELTDLFNQMRGIGPGDGPGSASWNNYGYGFGYYGVKIWRTGWLKMADPNTPAEVKELIREAFLLGGDRLSFAVGIERCNGNSMAQIPVALWYGSEATGDPLLKERFNVYFDRWRTEGWGQGSGLGPSGDAQEHFAYDCNYGSYILENWAGGIWVKPGILDDSKDPRFRQVYDRIWNLFTYIACKEVDANPWSSRTAQGAVNRQKFTLKGEPGPDLTVNVNDGNEWFAARRKNYYFLSYHGRLAPAWLSYTFHGQIGFGGGVICQLTVPGKGTVLASTQEGNYGYGKDMDVSNWRQFHIHSVVGEMADGRPLVSGIGEHDNAKLEANTVSSSGEVRERPVRVARKYVFQPDAIDCTVQLGPTAYGELLTLWSHDRPLYMIREAYEMVPFHKAKATAIGADGKDLGALTATPVAAKTVVIDRGGFGVRIELPQAMPVMLSAQGTSVLIELVNRSQPKTAADVGLQYRLVPYGG